jgi:uncharacterized protein (DUF58 family)
MDRRAIDWKQSARHTKLHAKQFRSERNNQNVFAVDAGRQMADPVAGVPRLDRAVSAMLLTAWVALKVGDRVALHAFDARPRLASGLVSGTAAFGELQRAAARIGYSGEESNYGFALTTLAARLNRRSMIVLLTEITDIVSADFLVRAAARLIERHLLLVVVLRDEELEAILDRPPVEADDIARSVTASALLRDRLLVLTACGTSASMSSRASMTGSASGWSPAMPNSSGGTCYERRRHRAQSHGRHGQCQPFSRGA